MTELQRCVCVLLCYRVIGKCTDFARNVHNWPHLGDLARLGDLTTGEVKSNEGKPFAAKMRAMSDEFQYRLYTHAQWSPRLQPPGHICIGQDLPNNSLWARLHMPRVSLPSDKLENGAAAQWNDPRCSGRGRPSPYTSVWLRLQAC